MKYDKLSQVRIAKNIHKYTRICRMFAHTGWEAFTEIQEFRSIARAVGIRGRFQVPSRQDKVAPTVQRVAELEPEPRQERPAA